LFCHVLLPHRPGRFFVLQIQTSLLHVSSIFFYVLSQ
jgi:hypothetical protein